MQAITLDYETYYAADFSLRKMSTESYIRDPRFKVHGAGIKINHGKAVWVPERLLPKVLAKLDWANSALIGHNLAFDGTILNWHHGIKPKRYIDTLGMSRALIGQHLPRHGLTYVAEALLGSGKTEGLAQTMGIRDLSPQQEKILADYCLNDVEKTWGIFCKMAPHFPKQEYYVMDWVTRQFAQPKLYLDADMLEEYIGEVRQLKVDALASAGLETRDLLMSADKYAAALESLGVSPPVKINAEGKISFAFAKTDEAHKALLEYDANDDEAINAQVQALVAARLEIKSTIEETRAVKYFDAAPRGPWPVDYNYAGAKNTHRLSGANGGGGNPTNLKRGGKLRKAIYAPEGYKLVVADLSQIECRMVLWLGAQMPRAGGEAEALEVMRTGGDLYSHFGTLMYGYTIDKNIHKIERQIAKSAVLGLGFGMGPGRFMDYCKSMGIKIEPIMAESAVALYRNTYTGVRQYWGVLDRSMKSAVYDGIENLKLPLSLTSLPVCDIVYEPLFSHVALRSYSGLMLKYPDLSWDAEGEGTYRDGNTRVKVFGGKFVENEVQHLARCVLMDMLREIDPVYPCVMSTYDELVMLVEEDKVDEATAFATEVMTRDHPQFPGLPLGVETGSHSRYGMAKG